MNKKLFSWKALAGLALLVAMGLTSCQQGSIVDPSDPTGSKKPTTDPAAATPTAGYVIAGDSMNVTALTPSDITKALAELVKPAAKTRSAGKTYNVAIASANLKVNSKDYVIEFPEVTDATWNITFDGLFAEDAALLHIVDPGLDFVNITLPEGAFMGFYFDMPYSTVTLNGESTIGEIGLEMDEANVRDNSKRQTIGDRCLTLENGVKVDGLNWVNGAVVVKNGAEVASYIAGTHPNRVLTFTQRTWKPNTGTWKNATEEDSVSVENVIAGNDGIQSWEWDNINSKMITKYEAVDENGNPYFLQNIIVRATSPLVDEAKGEEYKDYGFVSVSATSRKNPVEKIVVEDGARLELNNNWADEGDNYQGAVAAALTNHNYGLAYSGAYAKPNRHFYVKNIIGLGKGTGIVTPGNWNYAFNDADLVSNVTISKEVVPYDIIPDASYIDGSALGYYPSIRMRSNVEKSTFKGFTDVEFYTPITEVKECKFPVGRIVRFDIDASKGSDKFDFSYNTCQFIAGANIGVNAFVNDGVLLDEDGMPIVYKVWDYAKVTADGKSYVYEQSANVRKYNTKTSAWEATDADGAPYMSNTINTATRKIVKTKPVEVTVGDIKKWDEVSGWLYMKDGVYCAYDAADDKYYQYDVTFFNVWEYNKKIEYTDIPTLARKDGLVNNREVYAMENYPEVNDMRVTITLPGSTFGGKAVTKNTPVNASLPQYYNGNTGRNDAKITYRFDLDGVLYRLAYDNVGRQNIFIKAN